MMKYLLSSSLLMVILSCSSSATNAQQNGEAVMGKVNPRTPLRQESDQAGNSSPALIMRMGEAKAKKGQLVCLPVEATGFNNLIGLQYTMRFDSAALEYKSIRATSLPGYGADNFGTRFAERGVVSTLWTDLSLKGVTKEDNYKMFEICFINLQDKGQETEVRFSDGPTSFEVVAADMAELRFVYANGKVTSK
ncbi:hypothetical protein FUA23_17255 [Neolewinella aurantiaca]|uniref:Cohesin domain-containing protein n=1 Tax=Neolewinella aurantiaca TaxID=2602767 RepID=A0A5C7FKB7_9BACT|nr:cohesin domain-containing protein [Neolewinella aurantiaca]TXF87806.1 hypothetical protein FUA23_17255 [Neolewinella aurantiaca]